VLKLKYSNVKQIQNVLFNNNNIIMNWIWFKGLFNIQLQYSWAKTLSPLHRLSRARQRINDTSTLLKSRSALNCANSVSPNDPSVISCVRGNAISLKMKIYNMLRTLQIFSIAASRTYRKTKVLRDIPGTR